MTIPQMRRGAGTRIKAKIKSQSGAHVDIRCDKIARVGEYSSFQIYVLIFGLIYGKIYKKPSEIPRGGSDGRRTR